MSNDKSTRRVFKVIAEQKRGTVVMVHAICPFCDEEMMIAKWSLYGTGKVCRCGAKLLKDGTAEPFKPGRRVPQAQKDQPYGDSTISQALARWPRPQELRS